MNTTMTLADVIVEFIIEYSKEVHFPTTQRKMNLEVHFSTTQGKMTTPWLPEAKQPTNKPEYFAEDIDDLQVLCKDYDTNLNLLSRIANDDAKREVAKEYINVLNEILVSAFGDAAVTASGSISSILATFQSRKPTLIVKGATSSDFYPLEIGIYRFTMSSDLLKQLDKVLFIFNKLKQYYNKEIKKIPRKEFCALRHFILNTFREICNDTLRIAILNKLDKSFALGEKIECDAASFSRTELVEGMQLLQEWLQEYEQDKQRVKEHKTEQQRITNKIKIKEFKAEHQGQDVYNVTIVFDAEHNSTNLARMLLDHLQQSPVIQEQLRQFPGKIQLHGSTLFIKNVHIPSPHFRKYFQLNDDKLKMFDFDPLDLSQLDVHLNKVIEEQKQNNANRLNEAKNMVQEMQAEEKNKQAESAKKVELRNLEVAGYNYSANFDYPAGSSTDQYIYFKPGSARDIHLHNMLCDLVAELKLKSSTRASTIKLFTEGSGLAIGIVIQKCTGTEKNAVMWGIQSILTKCPDLLPTHHFMGYQSQKLNQKLEPKNRSVLENPTPQPIESMPPQSSQQEAARLRQTVANLDQDRQRLEQELASTRLVLMQTRDLTKGKPPAKSSGPVTPPIAHTASSNGTNATQSSASAVKSDESASSEWEEIVPEGVLVNFSALSPRNNSISPVDESQRLLSHTDPQSKDDPNACRLM